MENQEVKRKKLLYRSWYRGCKETDKILGFFVKKYVDDFTDAEIDELELILDELDVDIYDWISGKAELPERMKDNSMMQKIISFSFSDEFNRVSKLPQTVV
jgi:antitoxin CptB